MPATVGRIRLLVPALMALVIAAAAAASSHGASGTTVVSAYVPSATSLDVSGCANGSPATALGTVLPGSERIATAPCTVSFGSSNDTATLRMAQDDQLATAMSARTDGTPNPALGGGTGTLVRDVSGSDLIGVKRGGAMDADGGYLFTYTRASRASVTRLLPDGSVDVLFGGAGTGIATLPLPAGATATQSYAVQPLPDGKLLVGGLATMPAPTNNDVLVARLLPDGTPDATFGGGDGMVVQSYSDSTDIAYGFAVDAAGRILVTGVAFSSGDFDTLVARLLDDGTIDTTFGAGGAFVDLAPGLQQRAWDIDVDSAGRIVVGGDQSDGGWDHSGKTTNDAYVVRLDAGGRLDEAFGVSGRQLISYSPDLQDYYGGMFVDDEDRPFLTMATPGAASRQASAIRLRATDGGFDTAFGPGGKVDWDPATTNDYAYRAFQHAGGTYVVTGSSSVSGTLDPMLAMIPEAGGAPTDIQHFSLAPGFSEQMLSGGTDGRGGIAMLGYVDQGTGNDFAIAHFVGHVIEDYGDSAGAAWSATESMFGACLETLTSATSPGGYVGLDADGSCGASDADAWGPVPALASSVARTDAVGATGTAGLRFGMQVGTGQAPGAYAARVEFTVVAPAL